jgi:hypothetical protein
MSNQLHIEHVAVRLFRAGDQTTIGFWVFDYLSHHAVTDFDREQDVPADLPGIVAYCAANGQQEALDVLRQYANAGRGLHLNGEPVGNEALRAALAAAVVSLSAAA